MITSTNIIIIIVTVLLYIIYKYDKKKNLEKFMFMPWNMGTRFYPSYDIRGYPLIYPWNYPYPGLPSIYFSPYFYDSNGNYIYNPKYAKILNSPYRTVKS